MTIAPDMQDFATDKIAEAFYWQMPVAEIKASTGTDVLERTLWRQLPGEVREFFRARAERFMVGDTSLLRWSVLPGGG